MQQQPKEQNVGYSIAEHHPHHSILTPLLERLPSLFVAPPQGLNTQQPPCPFPFQISLLSCTSHPIYQYSFEFACSANSYLSILKDCKLQREIDDNIDEFGVIQQIDEQTQILYLAYKKVLIMQSRDFIYVRHTFKSKDGCTWIVSTSLPDRQHHPPRLRGSIILSATRIMPISDNAVKIQIHSQADMRMALKEEMARARGFAEIKKYTVKLHSAITAKQKQNKVSPSV